MISARTNAALEAAKARGVRLGLEKVNPVDPDGRTFAECIAETMVKMAIKGNVQAAVEICDRVEGKIKLSIGAVEDEELAEKSIEELERELEQSRAGRLSEESDTGTPVIPDGNLMLGRKRAAGLLSEEEPKEEDDAERDGQGWQRYDTNNDTNPARGHLATRKPHPPSEGSPTKFVPHFPSRP
jgi:hypothetical protein